MREAVEEDGAYDVMVIDCPPNLSAACVSAILASDAVIIPVLSDACSATGVADLMEQIDSLRYIRPEIRVAGVLVNQWHRSPVVEDAAAYLREDGRVPVYDTVIRRTDKVPESPGPGWLSSSGAPGAPPPGTTGRGRLSCWQRRGWTMSKPDLGRIIAQTMAPPADGRTIETITGDILEAQRRGGEAVLTIGRCLIEAKDMLPHGEWLPWLAEKVGYSEKTAQNFMRLARAFSNPQAIADLGAKRH